MRDRSDEILILKCIQMSRAAAAEVAVLASRTACFLKGTFASSSQKGFTSPRFSLVSMLAAARVSEVFIL